MHRLPRGLAVFLIPAVASLSGGALAAQGEPLLVRRIEGRRPADFFGVALAVGKGEKRPGLVRVWSLAGL